MYDVCVWQQRELIIVFLKAAILHLTMCRGCNYNKRIKIAKLKFIYYIKWNIVLFFTKYMIISISTQTNKNIPFTSPDDVQASLNRMEWKCGDLSKVRMKR